ncbi:MAG: phage tail protein I [Thermodesulfobacteriota bacterium]
MSEPADLLPPNATPQERALARAAARVSEVPVPVAALWNPATCPAALLPWLAWALSVDHWESGWSEAVKRAAIGESLGLHAKKGTPWAVERAFVVAGAPNATVVEWWEYAGDPYRFQVEIDLAENEVTLELERRLLATVDAWKNVRSWMDGIVYRVACAGPVPSFAQGLHASEVTTLYPPAP